MLVHTVYFYFKEGVSDADIAANIEGAKALGSVETVHALYVGTQADVKERPVTVRGWGFSMTALFNSIDDQNIYQAHEKHDEYIANFSGLWEKVQVFDAN